MINVPEPRYILLSAITTSKHRKDSIWQTTDIIGRIISDKDLHLKLQQQSDGLGEQVHAWRERGKNTIILGRDKIVVKKWNWQHFEVHENELNPRSLRAISVSNNFFFCISEFLKRFTLITRVWFFFQAQHTTVTKVMHDIHAALTFDLLTLFWLEFKVELRTFNWSSSFLTRASCSLTLEASLSSDGLFCSCDFVLCW